MKRFLFITFGWIPGRTRLMPWRTVFEVARCLKTKGHDVVLLSVNRDGGGGFVNGTLEWSVPVFVVNHLEKDITKILINQGADFTAPDVAFFPITWRSGLKNYRTWPKFDFSTIAYHGSGFYRKVDIFRALRYMPLKTIFPYLVDSLVPVKLLVSALVKRGVRGVICLSEFNKQVLISNDWPRGRVVAIPPGIDAVKASSNSCFSEKILQLCGVKYFLFIGNALPIRGFATLIDAALHVFRAHDSIKILCLVRSDPGNEEAIHNRQIARKLAQPELRERFVVLHENFAAEEVRVAIKGSVAVVMPFLLIPSEIPLGILEAMQEGAPIITTNSGGSSEFVGTSGFQARPADPKSLAEQMLRALNPEMSLSVQRSTIIERMSNHPDWDQVAMSWLHFAERCVSGREGEICHGE